MHESKHFPTVCTVATMTAGKARQRGLWYVTRTLMPLSTVPAPPRLSPTCIRRAKQLPTGARPEEGPCPARGLETTWGKQISEGVRDEHKVEQKALRSAQTLPRARRVSPPHWFLFSQTHPEAFSAWLMLSVPGLRLIK